MHGIVIARKPFVTVETIGTTAHVSHKIATVVLAIRQTGIVVLVIRTTVIIVIRTTALLATAIHEAHAIAPMIARHAPTARTLLTWNTAAHFSVRATPRSLRLRAYHQLPPSAAHPVDGTTSVRAALDSFVTMAHTLPASDHPFRVEPLNPAVSPCSQFRDLLAG